MKCDIRMLKFIISNLRPFVRFLFECQTEDQELEGRLKHADEVVQKVIQEYKTDPDIKCDIRMLKFIISNLRPFVRFLFECQTEDQELEGRLKHADEVVQKVIQAVQLPLTDVYQGNEDWELSPTNVQLLVSNMNIVGRVACEIFSMKCHVSKSRITLKSAEHLVTLMDSFLRNLKDAFVCRASTLVHIKKELRDMEERLMLLRNFLWFIEKNPIEQDNMKDVIHSAQRLVVYTLRVSFICYMAKMDDKVVSDLKDVLSNTVEKIDTLQEEVNDICKEYLASLLVAVPDDSPTMDEQVVEFADYLIHKLRLLSDNKAPCFIVAAKDLIDFLIDELSSLRCNLMDHLQLQNPIKEMKSLIISTLALIFRTGLFISYMHRDTKEDEEMTEYCCAKLPDLLKGVDNLKQQASDLFNVFLSRRPWQSDCPSTNVLEYDNFLINKLEQLLHSEASPLYALKHQTEAVYEEIVSMRKLLCAIADLENPKMEFLLTRYKDIVHQAEYVIDSFIAGEGSIWCHRLGLFVVTKDVKILQKEVKAILTMTVTCDTVIPSLYSGAPSQENNPPSTNATEGSKNEIHNRVEEAANKLVGLKDAEAEIIELLTGGSVQLKIVSIVGMPGLGKTSLANSVYKHPSVNLHFHVRAWCCVSQVYEKKTLLFDIYDQIVGETNQSHETSQVDFVQKLYQNLKGRKFLIVIDDIWDIEAWYDLKQTFPDDENGSRILFTTRHRGVALRAHSIPYALRLLSQEESCELLWLKLFDKETCPPELSTISKFIARNCKGLPLAVVLIAGILKGTERKEDCWELVAETSIKSQGTRGKYFEILELSFKHLPACLKPCFLYFGTFPEDTTILASKLIMLWICEGFVQKLNLGLNSLEEEAHKYLNELVNRSLVIIGRRSSQGGVKACRIHDVIRDFCSLKLQEERFLMQEDQFGGISILHGDHEMNIGSLFFYYRSDRTINLRRKSGGRFDRVELSERAVFWDKPFKKLKELSERNVFGSTRNQPTQLDYGFILQYKLLRVLDLRNVRVESSAGTSDLLNIAKLVCLRYLAIRVCTTEIPSEIGNLQNLETFILTGAIGKVMLPMAIWNLVSLRHIQTDYSFFSFQHFSQENFQNFSQLDNLKSISVLSLRHGDGVEKFILRRLTGIQKLGCKFLNSWDDSMGCNLFPALDFLSALESLKLVFSGKALHPCKFSFPVNLKKLTVSNARLPWDEISIIGQLPNLEVLKLLSKSFKGQQWDMKEGEFQRLKFLKLDSLDIELWNASSEHLPCLEQLVVLSCQELEVIPSSFGEISTLQLIEMRWCTSSATESVKQILQEQRDLSNDLLNITVVGPSLV